MKVAEKHYDDDPDQVMNEVKVLRALKHVSCKNMVTFHCSISVLC